ncbi:MAG: hypothetical protein NC131_12850 [Roseburia sp.]|nr:hypothetical protein [Roseburia sp.]
MFDEEVKNTLIGNETDEGNEVGGADDGENEEVTEIPAIPLEPALPYDPPSEIPCVQKLKRRFPEVEWWVLTDAYEKAKTTWLDEVFPYHQTIVEIPENMPRAERWLYDCAIEILSINNIADGMPLTMYKENGITMEWDSSMLSESLRRRLPPPFAKVVGKR